MELSGLRVIIVAPFFLGLLGCGAGGCPPIYVPVYEVSVYDSVSGDLICYAEPGTGSEFVGCDVSFDYDADGTAADISVSFTGFETQTLSSVANQTWRSGCWDNPEHTTTVEVFLIPNT